MRKIKILLVEDEITLAKIIKDTLEIVNFDVSIAYNGKDGLKLFFETKPDVLISDIMMPKMSGLEMVKKIRETDQNTPIIFLTAKTEVEDVIIGFENGANDYIRKPFAMKELIVRIKALTRQLSQKKNNEKLLFHLGDYQFNAEDGSLLHIPTGENKRLPNREVEVLKRFCQNLGSIVPMQNILLELWGDDDFFCARSLQVLISRIRNHLSRDKHIEILNIRGNGYKLIIK